MNTFVTIMCFALVACAAAKPGYNYPEPHQPFVTSASGSSSGFLSSQQSQQFSSFNVNSQPQYVSANGVQYAPQSQYVSSLPQYSVSASAPAAQQFYGPAPQYVAPVQHHGVYASSAPVISSSKLSYQKPQQQVIVSKEIYIHSAPEETEIIGEQPGIEASIPIRKNYRIVFIKAPAQNLQLNLEALKRAQAANEERTVIYVLSKKPDLANIQNQLVNVQSEQKTSKPEVFFIKYKTQEEASRAQQEIQAQYDALGGFTRISDEGIAPVASVIGGTSGLGGINIGGTSAFGNKAIHSSSVGSSFVSSSSVAGSSISLGSAADNSVNFGSIISPRTSNSGSIGSETPSGKYLPVNKKK
ncbi:hypothetical protein DOY81_007659 [Sarcophaga bullata]|nr:hypothetical protein DOY81_007659 [Sarcophaga bullata]